MKKNFLLIASLCVSLTAIAQPMITPLWENRNAGIGDNSDRYNKIIPDGNGNYYAVGYTQRSNNYKDFLTVKLDVNLDTIWTRTKNVNNGDDEAIAVATDAGGFIYVTGYADSGNTKNNIYTIKYDASGTLIWNKTYSTIHLTNDSAFLDDYPVAIAVDPAGDVVITGYSAEGTWTVNNDDIITIKYNPISGDVMWAKIWKGAAGGKDQPAAMAIDTAGNIFVTGRTAGVSDDDWITIKYDGSGNISWSRVYIGTGFCDDRATAIALDALANPVVTGRWCNGNDDDYRTVKYSATTGNILWARGWGGAAAQDDRPTAIAIDTADNIYVTGESAQASAPYKDYQVVTIKYNGSSIQQWYKSWNGNNSGKDDVPVAIKVDAFGNIYIAGTTDRNPSTTIFNEDYFAIKYDATPTLMYAAWLNGTADAPDIADDMVIDAAGNAIVVGRVENLVTQRDAEAVKYDAIGNPTDTTFYNGEADRNESGHALVLDPSGNSYVAGNTFVNQNNKDALFIKIDAAGITQCVNKFQGAKADDDEFSAIAYDGNGYVYACGYTKVSGEKSNYLVVKFNASTCDTVWTRIWGDTIAKQSDKAVSLAVDAAGNVYVTGYSDVDVNDTIDDKNIVTIKYDANGTQQWLMSYDGSGSAQGFSRDEPAKLLLDHTGNVVIAGRAEKVNDDDMVILKYDPANGNMIANFPQLANGFNGKDDRANDMAIDNSDNIYITGDAENTLGVEDYMTVKYNTGGFQQWPTWYDGALGTEPDRANALTVDGNGNVIVTGQSDMDANPLVTNYNYQTIMYNNNGVPNSTWFPPVGEYNGSANNDDVPVAVAVDASNNIYVTGQAGEGTSLTKNNNIRTVSYDANGGIRFYADYDGAANLSDAANAMVLASPAIFIAGSSEGLSNAQKDVITIKYDINVGINAVDKDANISVQPNPFTTSAMVRINPAIASSKNLSAKVYDVLGNEVMAVNEINSSFVIQRNNLAAGVYILKLSDGISSVANQKLIIE